VHTSLGTTVLHTAATNQQKSSIWRNFSAETIKEWLDIAMKLKKWKNNETGDGYSKVYKHVYNIPK